MDTITRFGPRIVMRVEDQRLTTGEGQMWAIHAAAHTAHLVFLRAPYAHAEIGAWMLGLKRRHRG